VSFPAIEQHRTIFLAVLFFFFGGVTFRFCFSHQPKSLKKGEKFNFFKNKCEFIQKYSKNTCKMQKKIVLYYIDT